MYCLYFSLISFGCRPHISVFAIFGTSAELILDFFAIFICQKSHILAIVLPTNIFGIGFFLIDTRVHNGLSVLLEWAVCKVCLY